MHENSTYAPPPPTYQQDKDNINQAPGQTYYQPPPPQEHYTPPPNTNNQNYTPNNMGQRFVQFYSLKENRKMGLMRRCCTVICCCILIGLIVGLAAGLTTSHHHYYNSCNWYVYQANNKNVATHLTITFCTHFQSNKFGLCIRLWYVFMYHIYNFIKSNPKHQFI